MPIYEYQCAECGFQKELIQKISDAPLTVCEQCGKATMKKMVSAAAFRLKGGGWYETDFKSGNKKNVAGDSKTESKPATKGASETKKAEGKTAPGSTTTTKKSPESKN